MWAFCLHAGGDMTRDCFEGHLQGRQSILQRRPIVMVECEYSEIGV